MWPSESLASRLYSAANWTLIVSLVFGVASTVLIVWMGNVKEGYLRKELADAGERAGRAEQSAGEAQAGNLKLGIDLEHAKAESRRRQTELEIEQRKTAEAQEAAAKAQLELQKRVEYVRKEAGPRYLSPRFSEALKGRPTGTVEILYNPGDAEAYSFALDIWRALKGAGWIASDPKPIPLEGGIAGSSPDAPAQLRHGTSGQIAIISKTIPNLGSKDDTPTVAIWNAVGAALDVNFGFSTAADPSLPSDHFIIVVGQK